MKKNTKNWIVLLTLIVMEISICIVWGNFNKVKAIVLNDSTINDINQVSSDVLVNKYNKLDQGYIPENMTIPYIYFCESISEEEKYMEYEAAVAIEKLVNGAEADGILLYGLSGYRSYKTQEIVYENNVQSFGEEYARSYVALPGQSEHQTGLAMDFATKEGFVEAGSIEAQWLAENSHLYGFILRYPQGKEEITEIAYEPWHVRYVGEEISRYIYDNGITLEEYMGY